MTESTARLSLPLLMPAQAQKHVTHNEALQLLDALTQLVLAGVDLDQPPASPFDGGCYGVGAAPVGDWTGQAGKIACRSGAGWQFVTPQDGWAAWDTVDQATKIYQAGLWVSGGASTQNLAGLGIQTTSDATNRLAVAADASLFTHDGSGHQIKINKAIASDTASILFQTGWTGHAEFGLAGDNIFSVKISPDGVAWQTAIAADPASGVISLGLPVTGAAIQSGPVDAAAGKLLTTGAFGWGDAAAAIASDNLDAIPASGVYLIDSAALAGTASLPAISLAGPKRFRRAIADRDLSGCGSSCGQNPERGRVERLARNRYPRLDSRQRFANRGYSDGRGHRTRQQRRRQLCPLCRRHPDLHNGQRRCGRLHDRQWLGLCFVCG
jgi:hypothetical protein